MTRGANLPVALMTSRPPLRRGCCHDEAAATTEGTPDAGAPGRQGAGTVMDPTVPDGALLMEAADLDRLHAALQGAGYRVIGPTVRDGAIILGELGSAGDLPFGWGVSLAPGGYRVRQRDDSAAFGHSAGPQSWKQFLHPPREKVWSVPRG